MDSVHALILTDLPPPPPPQLRIDFYAICARVCLPPPPILGQLHIYLGFYAYINVHSILGRL